MKALTSVLAVLLLLSCTSLAQTAASTPSADAAAASPGAVPAAPSVSPFAPGAKVFLEPMDGFEQLLADSILHKKVPVVIVNERAKADFVMSGEAHVKNRGFITGMVLSSRGGANIAMKDARTGNLVFACNFHRVDSNERDGDIYLGWADQCAGHLKKAMKKK
jgi:hypothetical protein